MVAPPRGCRLSSPSTTGASNSPRVRVTHRVGSAAREVQWEATSGLAALLECGATAGSAAAAAVVRVCAAVVAMADARLQQLRRSISSWSLSTFKKPKITIPKLKTPSLNLFTGRKRNRVNPKDEEAATEEVKAALLKAEGPEGDRVDGEVIHEPTRVTGETQPTIVLTVHDRAGTPDLSPPTTSSGLLSPNDDIDYIDSDEGEDERFNRGASTNVDYSDTWFDCHGTLSRSREDLSRVGIDYDEGHASAYYEAAEPAAQQHQKTATTEPKDIVNERLQKTDAKVIADDAPNISKESKPAVLTKDIKDEGKAKPPQEDAQEAVGSHKARAWVKSLDEDTEVRVKRWIEMQKTKNSADIPKSKSEIRLDSLDEPSNNWSARNEIQLNAAGDDEAYAEYLRNYNAVVDIPPGDQEIDDAARRESLKRVFQVRGKLSIKPIVDSQRPSYKDADIYIASTPYALANSSGHDESRESEDGINFASVDLEPALELSGPSSDSTQGKSKSASNFSSGSKEKDVVAHPETPAQKSSHPIPDIVINEPEAEKNEDEISRVVRDIDIGDSNDYASDTTTENACDEVSSSQEVTWSEDNSAKPLAGDSQNQNLELCQSVAANNIVQENDNTDSNTLTPQSSNKNENEKENILPQKKDDVPSPKGTDSDRKKPDRKKKISAPNIPKSIKNFAGSIFSQQTDSKSRKEQIEEKDAEKKKRRSRLSPFTKDYLFKSSPKENKDVSSSDKKVLADISISPANIVENVNKSCEKGDINLDIAQETPGFKQCGQENCIDQVESDAAVKDLPSSESLKSVEETGGGSSESLEYISPIDSDEQKSISHESSPGVGSRFVEEDGLLIRKDALLAVKAMENDDTSTHYYSFLSATDDIQPLAREVEKPTLPIKKVSSEPSKGALVNQDPPLTSAIPAVKSVSDDLQPVTSKVAADESMRNSTHVSTEPISIQNSADNPPVLHISASEKVPMKIMEAGQTVQSLPISSSKEPVPPEVPKLKLTPSLPQESQEPPKPSPRTKKGRYGYSTGSSTPTTPTAPVNTILSFKETQALPPYGAAVTSSDTIADSSTKGLDSTAMATFPRRKTPSSHTHMGETERNSGDSGYAGTGNNYYETEPIYWEISETKGGPPRPSPRGKKGQRTPSEQSLNVNAVSLPPKLEVTNSQAPPLPTVPIPTERQNVPEWINKRAPIPSPRTKKQRSLQSLPTVVPTEETMESVKKKLQSMSSVPISSSQVVQPSISKNAPEEQFYSGKAASIAYGYTPDPALPSPPVRGKKASQISLPAAMAVEETLSRQQKRSSLHEFGLTRSHDKGNAPHPPSVRRSRRRTDPTQGYAVAALRKAVQLFDANLMGLTDLLVAIGLGATSVQKSEEHLCGVLYSVQSLMGGTGGGSWTVSSNVSSSGDASGPDKKNTVTLAQVTKELQAAYQVDSATLERLVKEASSRPTPEVHLHLSVKEAKDLRPKTVKGKTNAYATVVIPSSGDTHRTRLQKGTLDPRWNQEFTLRVNNLQKDVLRLEVWHEHDNVGVQHLTAVRDIKSFGRLVKGTTEQAKHQASHLLGRVVLHIKNMSEGGADGWYPLEKDGELAKDRGTVRLEGKVVSSAQLDQQDRKSYDALLTRVVHHQLTAKSNKNQEMEWSPPWNGRLSPASTAALAQHAIMLGLSDAQLQLSWWLVGSHVATVDAAWTLSQLHRVQAALAKGLYQEDELAELRSSLSYFVRAHTERFKDLHTNFPSSSGVLAQSQLMYTLKALHSLQTHAASRELLDQEAIPNIHELVTSSIGIHSKNWWTLLVEEQLRGVKTADEQISRVIKIVDEAYIFLNKASVFYNPAFVKEMNIPYMQTTYLMVSKKINPCVRPLLMNIYNRMPAIHDQDDTVDSNVQYALEVGTSLWQLYRNLGRLHTLSETLPSEARAESGVREYHRWFSKGVMRWLEMAVCRAQDMIRKAVELDNFVPVDTICDFSSSATDTTGIFHDVKIWWLKLSWPDPEHSAVLLAKILEDVCSCGTIYCDLLRAKVDTMFHRQANTSRVFITQQICVGLNNIERVRRELTGLPGHFGFDATLEEIRRSGNAEAASQLEATVERLIISATENMEAKVNEFIETVIEKMKPSLERALNEACEAQSEVPLLDKELDPAIQLLHNHLHTSNFQRFLWYLWEVLISLFDDNVSRNAERRKAAYFGGVHEILEATLKFFSPDEGIGLDPEEARTKEYSALLELLDSLRMSTESLIAKYYKERYDEQAETNMPSKAQLVVKMLFTRPGKLIVEVIMARDMVTDGDSSSISSRGGGLHPPLHREPVDSYVKVQLVPQEWFPSAAIRKTRTQRKADPAVYEETFEYDLSKSDDGVQAGLLMFTLKDYNLGRSNTFIGEATVPLTTLPCVDSSQVHTVPNTYLKMTTPGLDIGYKSLRALHLRTGDRIACNFLKKVSKRLQAPRAEEDRPRPKSPNLIDRLKFS